MVYVAFGGGGFLGANLIAEFQKKGDFTEIIVVDPAPRLRTFTHLKIDERYVVYDKGSLLDEDTLNRVLPGVTTVFHLSAIGHTGAFGARKNHSVVRNFNVDATKNLVKHCKMHGVRNFIYASSIAVAFVGKPLYDSVETDPYPAPHEYLDIYSSTKAEAEAYIRSVSTDNFRTTCLRFRAIYGPQDVSVAAKVVTMVRWWVMHFKIAKNRQESISNMSSGRNCGLSMYLANQELLNNGQHGQVYNITDGVEVGQYTLWEPLIKALGQSPPQMWAAYSLASPFVSLASFVCLELLEMAPPLTRFELEVLVTDNTYSIEKARKELGYIPEKGHFQETVEYYRLETQQKEKEPRHPIFETMVLNLKHLVSAFIVPFTFSTSYYLLVLVLFFKAADAFDMHPRKDVAIYITYCVVVLLFIHAPLICQYLDVPLHEYVDCSIFCLPMNLDYAGFHFILILLNIVVTAFLPCVIKRIKKMRIKWSLRVFLGTKVLIIFFVLIATFSAEMAAVPSSNIHWVLNFSMVRLHLLMEVVVSISFMSLITNLENQNVVRLRIRALERLESYSPSNMMYYAPPKGQEVVQPSAPTPPVPSMSIEEQVLNGICDSLQRAMIAHHNKYPLVTFRPPIRFEDYD